MKANHRVVEIPASNLKKEITKVLFDKGYIRTTSLKIIRPQGIIKIALKYNPITKIPAIRTLTRVSKPGLRKYAGADNYATSIKWFRNCYLVYFKRCND